MIIAWLNRPTHRPATNRTLLMRAPGGPRLLLRRLREVMAEPVTAQARLDRIVVLIASNMVAEVCSLYVVRADGAMELFATEGLNREAVHLTTHAAGRGPCRPDRLQRRTAGAVRRAASPGLFLQARDGRRNLPVLPRRAGVARRRDDRGAGGAKPRARAPIRRKSSRRCRRPPCCSPR